MLNFISNKQSGPNLRSPGCEITAACGFIDDAHSKLSDLSFTSPLQKSKEKLTKLFISRLFSRPFIIFIAQKSTDYETLVII